MHEEKETTDGCTMSRQAPVQTTLLRVVTAVAEVADTDEEVVAVIDDLFRSGRMKLVGQFTNRDFGL